MAFAGGSGVRSVFGGPAAGTALLLAVVCASASDSAALTIRPYLLTPTPDGKYVASPVWNYGGDKDVVWANELNNAGQVVGHFNTWQGTRAFIWEQGHGMRDLGVLGTNISSFAEGINDQGQVVGFCGQGPSRAFIWDETNGMRELAGPASSAEAINNAGQVTGWAGSSQPYVWTAAGAGQGIGSFGFGVGAAINSLGQVAGMAGSDISHQSAFLWSESAGVTDLGVLPGAAFSRAEDLNDFSLVVGSSRVNGQDHAFMWGPRGGMQALPQFGVESFASGVNNAGVIVGGCVVQYESVRSHRAAIWRSGQVTDLNTLLMPGYVSYPLSYARAINDKGQILAVCDSDLSPPIPEPATMSLLAAAGALGMVRRRRR